VKIRAVLIAVAACATFAPTAHAQEVPLYSDTLVISGCLNTNPPVPLLRGVGAFYGPTQCAAPYNGLPTACELMSDPDLPGLEGPGPCTVNFSGSYSNIICTTMTMAGTMSVGTAYEFMTMTFTVSTVTGVGIVTGFSPDDDGGDTWVGTMTLVPTAPFPPSCPVSQWQFTMVLNAVDL
jgi:hypothetical protein